MTDTATEPTEVAPKKRIAKRPSKKKAATKSTAKKGPAKKPAAKSRPATKKATASKSAAKKTAKKAPAKKSATASKKAPAKTAAKSNGKVGGFHRELDENGFVPGTDSAKIAELLLKGGKDRAEVNARVEKAIGTETRNGTMKNVPALVSGVLNRLIEQGYKVDSSWVLVAPARKRKAASRKK